MGNTSSSPKQIEVEFTPWILTSEPTSVSNDSSTLLMLPKEILRKIGEFADIMTVLNLIATCKYIRKQPNTWFLQLLASENNPDRATSGFIVDAIGNEGNARLWHNAKFFIKDHDIPKDLSIHPFANTTAEKISSDEVRSMIIQSSGLPGSHVDIHKYLKFFFSKVSFKNMKYLMLCGIEFSEEFYRETGALNLDVFHMGNLCYDTKLDCFEFLNYWDSLKTLYLVHPNAYHPVFSSKELRKLVIYCPKSNKDVIERPKALTTGLLINVKASHALKEM